VSYSKSFWSENWRSKTRRRVVSSTAGERSYLVEREFTASMARLCLPVKLFYIGQLYCKNPGENVSNGDMGALSLATLGDITQIEPFLYMCHVAQDYKGKIVHIDQSFHCNSLFHKKLWKCTGRSCMYTAVHTRITLLRDWLLLYMHLG